VIESILGIIPARGGSKRLPGKNLKLLNGKTLLAITIEQARHALPVSIVTSDNAEIINEALACGVRALLRPASLATDTATSGDVVKHVLSAHPGFEWFCLLQPTSPCRLVSDIQECMLLAEQTGKPVVSTFCGKPNGAIYIGKTLSFVGDFLHKAVFYEMPLWRSVDIDTQEDLDIAKIYLTS
jgi:CMP-N-acetylneuraminic acid synthetase